ncbi:FAD-dependent oxidoreductase [Nocardia aobensis]|uniref:ferredoxin--NADP(+) reductase n=1 Tax=Nocardia aobensis TaxID=257277 RepID=A0ABW6P9X6_9NOCA
MAYVVTQKCCNDASCVSECPVDCIRPRPEDPEFTTAEMLYIDPNTCIDCQACADACPVGAIYADSELPSELARFQEVNASYFERRPLEIADNDGAAAAPARIGKDHSKLRVAIVGAGPSAAYAAGELMRRADVDIDMFDRLPTPHGLIRAGVAPDHAATKTIAATFDAFARRKNFRYLLNVEVGKHITHDELTKHYHAVVYAVGASADRRLDIPGEDVPGSHSATEFVAWYNGHPEYADRRFDLTGETAVIVGNGNVALDVARILTTDPEILAKTDIADHALEALRHSTIREVVLLGRRGPLQAAYTSPEFMALGHLPGVDVVIDPDELTLTDAGEAAVGDSSSHPSLALKYELAREYAAQAPDPSNKRIVFRYLVSPTAVLGSDRAEAVVVEHNELDEADGVAVARATGRTETIPATLVLRSVGYQGRPVADLPFDDQRCVVPNLAGRVITTDDTPLPGTYVTGWIKRGPRGVIGTNRLCAEETVNSLLDDFVAGRLSAPAEDAGAVPELLSERRPEMIERAGWQAIDTAERTSGKAQRRPRVKFVSVEEMIATARAATTP